MIYVFSNRNIINDGTWLGDTFNVQSNENLRVARYIPSPEPKLAFYTEEEGKPLPSTQVINEVESSDKPCCLFIHGFNQSLTRNMRKCEEIESYGVNVIAFSWPSNPGPHQWYWKIKEYRAATQNARRSTVALERFFDKFNHHILSAGSVNNIKSMVVHSLGNYLLQSFISGLGYNNQTCFLNNILLHQADVNSLHHEKWANCLTKNSRVIATINESDDILDISNIINPDRLGNTLCNLNSNTINYVNFGRLPEADDEHRLWMPPTTTNENAKAFFATVFAGKKVLTGHLEYDEHRNCYHI